ncbi:MAG: GDSL-type esterase/lipase family protein [Candidatus Alcyoniella australis]|nr:GDSL-type esterase/lipase family protein [Candidatus Alcyoniella australis]
MNAGHRSGGRRRVFDIILLLASTAITLLLVEAGFRRYWTPHEAHQILDNAGRNLYIDDQQLGHRMLPDFIGLNYSPEFEVAIRTNSAGYRDSEFGSLGPGARRVLCLGDSIVFGYGAQQHETIPARLESALAQRGPRPVEFFNLGCSGYCQGQARVQLERWLPRYKPELVLVFFFLGNDPDDNLNFRVDIENQPLPNLPQPPGWSLYKRLRHGIYSRSRLAQFVAIRSWGLLMRWNLVESAPAKELGLMQVPPDARALGGWQISELYLDQIGQLCARHGAQLLVVALPSKSTVIDDVFQRGVAYYGLDPQQLDRGQPEKRLMQICDRLQIDALSLVEPLRNGIEQGAPMFFAVDPHPSPAGLELIARNLADPCYERIERRDRAQSGREPDPLLRELAVNAARRLLGAGLALSGPN